MRALAATFVGILISGCAANGSSYVVHSRDAINPLPSSAPFSFTAEVNRHDDRMYHITMHSDQMNAAGFYAFCIAAHAAGKAGYPRYVMGAKNPKEKTLGRSTLTFPTLLLKGSEKPETVGPAGYTWGQIIELDNPIFRDSCSRMMRSNYLW
jgi:hypothetical protein